MYNQSHAMTLQPSGNNPMNSFNTPAGNHHRARTTMGQYPATLTERHEAHRGRGGDFDTNSVDMNPAFNRQ